jgi:hypothetical protein
MVHVSHPLGLRGDGIGERLGSGPSCGVGAGMVGRELGVPQWGCLALFSDQTDPHQMSQPTALYVYLLRHRDVLKKL